jgi:hypothetical protein
MSKTMKQLAQDALNVQDACNLSAVVHGFSRTITDLRELVTSGTDAINQHPICILWADKIASLTGTQSLHSNDRITQAYNWAHKEIAS